MQPSSFLSNSVLSTMIRSELRRQDRKCVRLHELNDLMVRPGLGLERAFSPDQDFDRVNRPFSILGPRRLHYDIGFQP
jgi:hypothetical protein